MQENINKNAESLDASEAPAKLTYTPHGPAKEEDLGLYKKAVLSWETPEYIQHDKSSRWYLIAGIVIALGILSATMSGNWTMVLAIIAFAGVYHYTQSKHPPKEIEVVISEMGIKVGDMVFPYTHIQAFWVIYHPPLIKTLNLRVNGHFYSDIVIQLNEQDPVQVRQFLCTQVPEWEGKNERLGDILLRLLKL